MNDLNKEIERILNHLDRERWIAFSKDDSSTTFKAKDKLRAYGLIEKSGKFSWQLTKEGYKAVELGGFSTWLNSQNRNGLFEKTDKVLSKFLWYFVMPIIVGLIIWYVTERKDSDTGSSEPKYSTHSISEQNITANQIADTIKQTTDTSIVYLQSYSPKELFNGDLIITLNNSIEVVNGEIDLKLVQKSVPKTELFGNKKVGDIIIFRNYIISLLSLERNISTYDLRVRIEAKK